MTDQEQAAAIQQLPPDWAILKLENDNITAMAAARPRDYKQILASIAEQVELFPSFAESAIYSRPVGKGDDGRQVFATGLSVRAAEAIAEAYGYCRVRCTTTHLDDDSASVEATFVDYQRGRIWQQNIVLSRFQKRRSGQTVRLSDERFELLCKAKASIVIREVILRSVPPGLRAALEQKVREAVRLDPKTVDKILGNFASRGADQEELEGLIGKPIEGWTQSDRIRLLEVWNALQDGETTIEELFGRKPKEEPQQDKPAGGGSVDPDAFMQPQAVEPPKKGKEAKS